VVRVVVPRGGVQDVRLFPAELAGLSVCTGAGAGRRAAGGVLLGVEIALGAGRTVRLDGAGLRDAELDRVCGIRGATTARADAPLLGLGELDRADGLLRGAGRARAARELDDCTLRDTGRRGAEPLVTDRRGGLPLTSSDAVPSAIRMAGIMASARHRPLRQRRDAFMAKPLRVTHCFPVKTFQIATIIFC